MRILLLPARVCILALAVVQLMPHQSASAQAQVRVKSAVVRPGERQTVLLHGIGGAPFEVHVTMPDGETLTPAPGSLGASPAKWTFIQPPNTITHGSRRATVSLTMNGEVTRAHYTVGFAPIDLVAPHGLIPENSSVTVWVHTQPRTPVQLQNSWVDSPSSITTGPRGWARTLYRFPNVEIAPPYSPTPVSIVASATFQGRHVSTRADFMVRPFQFQVYIRDIQILHQVGTAWVPTTTVRVGEAIEVRGTPSITEPAGTDFECVGATISLVQANQPALAEPMQCMNQGMPQMIADLTVGPELVPGPAEIDVDASFENGTFHTVIPITVTA